MINNELSGMRSTLRNGLSCEASVDSFRDSNTGIISCSGPIALYAKDNTELISVAGSTMGRWTLHASCDSNGINVIGSRSGSTRPNQLFGTDSIYSICAEFFGALPRVLTKDFNLTEDPFTEQGVTAADCALLKPPSAIPIGMPPNQIPWPVTASGEVNDIKPIVQKTFAADAACNKLCSSDPFNYTAGYLVDCFEQVDLVTGSTWYETCTCFR